MSKPNLTNQPTSPVPVIKGNPPRPAGSIISADRLSDWERKQLAEKFGYDGVSEVPSDLASRIEDSPELAQAFAQASAATPNGWVPVEQQQGLDLDNVKTVYDEAAVQAEAERITANIAAAQKAVAVSQAAKDDPKADYFEAVRSAAVDEIKQAAAEESLHPNIQDALTNLRQEMARDEASSVSQSPEPAENQFSEPAPAPVEDNRTDSEKFDAQMREKVSEADADAYRDAVLNFASFTKTYELMNGAIKVTFGDHGIDEYEMLVKQESIDKTIGRIDANLTEILTNSNNLSLSIALRTIETPNGRPVDVPANMGLCDFLDQLFSDRSKLTIKGFIDSDTNLRVWYRFLAETVLKGSFSHLIYKKYEDFKGLMNALRYVSKEPEFFNNPVR